MLDSGYSGGAATCNLSMISHLTRARPPTPPTPPRTSLSSARVTTITLSIGVLLPGVPLCSASLSGYDSSVELAFESPLGCPMFDSFSSIPKILLETTNTTSAALEVVNASCGARGRQVQYPPPPGCHGGARRLRLPRARY